MTIDGQYIGSRRARSRRTSSTLLGLLVWSVGLGGLLGCVTEPTEERLLRIAVSTLPSSFDPHWQDESPAYELMSNSYEGLVRFDGQMRVGPALAESWSSPDDVTWRFQLRSNVRFHDGTAFGAEDVVASFERARLDPQSQVSGYLSGVESVEAVDDSTIVIKTHAPYPILLNKLAFVWIAPSERLESTGELSSVVGTGPYRLARNADEVVRLQRFEDYWGEPGAIASASFQSMTGGQRVEAMIAREVDIASVPVSAIDRILDEPGVALRGSETLDMAYLHLDLTKAPFSDVRVRRALHTGLDRNRLVEVSQRGRASPSSQFVPPAVYGFNSMVGPPRVDAIGAQQLMIESGFGDGLDIDIEVFGGRLPEELHRQLGELGFRVNIVSRQWSEIYPRLVAGEVPFYYGLYSLVSAEASDLLDSRIHTRDSALDLGESNFGGYSNPEIDGLIEELVKTKEFLDRRELMRRCFEILDRDVPLVPLFVPYARYGVVDELEWDPRPDGLLNVQSMGWRGSP